MRLWHVVGTKECDRLFKQLGRKSSRSYVWVWCDEWKHLKNYAPRIGEYSSSGVKLMNGDIIPWQADGMYIKSIDLTKIPEGPFGGEE